MEKMTEAEREKLKELQAKYKRVQREEAQFLKDADDNKEMLMDRWHLDDRLHRAAEMYGISADDLYAWITRQSQIDFYHRQHDNTANGGAE